MAIGWHFLYEGVEKVYSTPEGKGSFLARILPPPNAPPPMDKPDAPFSAEGYLRNSSGPLAPYFRSLVPDIDSRSKLELEPLKASWAAELQRVANHYNFTSAQRDEAEKALRSREAIADEWFRDPENQQKIKKYYNDLEHFLKVERDPEILASERAQAYKDRTTNDAARRELVQTVDAWTGTLRDAWMKLVTEEQAQAAGTLPVPITRIDVINVLTKYGLIAVGLCLLLGLFTPIAALGGAAYLAMFYFSMPPWPGLPESPMAEGHYLFVNKNLIELIACLALARIPTGLWVGLDALLFGWVGRRRRQPAAPELFDAGPAHSPAEHRGPTGTLTRSDR